MLQKNYFCTAQTPKYTGVAQLVEHWSPKPGVGSSSLSSRAEFGELAEWSKAHAWKVCIPQKGIEGSNPSLSAV